MTAKRMLRKRAKSRRGRALIGKEQVESLLPWTQLSILTATLLFLRPPAVVRMAQTLAWSLIVIGESNVPRHHGGLGDWPLSHPKFESRIPAISRRAAGGGGGFNQVFHS